MWGSDGVVKMLNYFCGTVECLVIFRKVLWVQPHIIIGYDLQFVRMQAFPFKYALWTTWDYLAYFTGSCHGMFNSRHCAARLKTLGAST